MDRICFLCFSLSNVSFMFFLFEMTKNIIPTIFWLSYRQKFFLHLVNFYFHISISVSATVLSCINIGIKKESQKKKVRNNICNLFLENRYGQNEGL